MSVDTTIVTCVEAGPLEIQVLLLAESLRAFGGPSSKLDFVAVKPRRGPGISPSTLQGFKRLGVEFVDEKFNKEFDWWNNANKSAVMSQLETRVRTRNITWMDGDMVVLQPIDDLTPRSGTDFISRAGEGYLGSDGSDENAPYWRKLCELAGLEFDQFPEIISFPERRAIRAYWQSGVYTYDTSTRLGATHYEVISKLLSSHVGSIRAGVYHQDQVSISLAVQKLKLRHSEFLPDMNFNLNPLSKESADIVPMRDVKILHYHGAFYADALTWTKAYIERLPRDRLDLINQYIPFSANASYLARAHKKVLRAMRQRRVERFKDQAVLY